jgi:hypothetical protein
MVREPVNVETTNITIDGTSKRDITARKWQYLLEYKNISTTDANTIYTIYNLQTTVTWQVTETNFTVSSRDVHVDISPRQYFTHGSDYLVNLILTLTEVDET